MYKNDATETIRTLINAYSNKQLSALYDFINFKVVPTPNIKTITAESLLNTIHNDLSLSQIKQVLTHMSSYKYSTQHSDHNSTLLRIIKVLNS